MPYLYTVEVYVDGACKPNPGSAGIGIVICSPEASQNPLLEISYFITQSTNQKAEYLSVIKAMDIARKDYTRQKLICFSDSELVINHAKRNFRVRTDSLLPYFYKLMQLMDHFKKGVEFYQISQSGERRYHNRAHKLSKQALFNRSPILDIRELLSLQGVVV